MSFEKELYIRSQSKCELCAATENLGPYKVSLNSVEHVDESILICSVCHEHIKNIKTLNNDYWVCLKDSMWSPVPAVQVMAWHILNQIRSEAWAQNLLDMMYLEDTSLAWAQSLSSAHEGHVQDQHLDCNGVPLQAGDTVTIIKNLSVKGTSFVAKRGTSVRGISLVADHFGQIEGRVNGQKIVILTEFVKKA